MTKRAVPSVPSMENVTTRRFLLAIKENIESMNGARGGKIKPLGYSHTDAQLVEKINEIIESLQG